MADEMIEVVLDGDGDENIYPNPGESEIEFEARMNALSKKLDARMSDEEKQQVDELM